MNGKHRVGKKRAVWIFALVFVLIGGHACRGLDGTEKTHMKKSFDGFLFEDQKGDIWIVKPLISLGMIGVGANPPVYRLSPELAERYRPLAMTLEPKPEDGSRVSYWYWGYPRPADPDDPTILVNIETEVRLLRGAPVGASSMTPYDLKREGPWQMFEIYNATLVSAEFASSEWRKAWDRLDELLKDIVAETLTAPGEEKRDRLKALIDEAAVALDTVKHPKVEGEWQSAVHKIDPNARFVTGDQRSKASEWGRALKRCVERLGIQPAVPLPKLPDSTQGIRITARSESPGDFLSRFEETFGEGELDRLVFQSKSLGRMVAASEIVNASTEAFDVFRTEAKGILECCVHDSTLEDADVFRSVTVDDPGLVVRPIGPDLLAEKMVLGGILIEEVLPEGEKIGLEPGDVIVTVKRISDLTMKGRYGIWLGVGDDGFDEKAARRALSRFVDGKTGKLRAGTHVVRGDAIIAVKGR